ncbi:MAG: exodeoxyribonuclease VII large subunit, partial [Pseudomonadota bacterium]
GHLYFTLKDDGAQVRAVMFRTKLRYLDFEPNDGQEALVRGRLAVYELKGEYQIVLDYLEPLGEGALRLAYEKLKAKLAAEGLFAEERKKPPPFLPRRVALVTSPTGAAVRDFIQVARRRYDNAWLSVYPVRVQGEGAAQEIAAAIGDLNRWGGFDLIVLTRGGGSLEDLWAFNQEVVARAIAASEIPVVSAVGHEVDFTIADLASDLRAPTPSAAAALIFREKSELLTHLARSRRRLAAGVRGRLNLSRERLSHFHTRLGDPRRALAEPRIRLDDLTEDLIHQARRIIEQRRTALDSAQAGLAPKNPRLRLRIERSRLGVLARDLVRAVRASTDRSRFRLSSLAGRLNDLSPLAVLERGYALALKAGRPIRSSDQARPGDVLNLILARGELAVIVERLLK